MTTTEQTWTEVQRVLAQPPAEKVDGQAALFTEADTTAVGDQLPLFEDVAA